MRAKTPESTDLKELFNELEFKNLASRILGNTDQMKAQSDGPTVEEPTGQLNAESNEGPPPEAGTLFGNPLSVIPGGDLVPDSKPSTRWITAMNW